MTGQIDADAMFEFVQKRLSRDAPRGMQTLGAFRESSAARWEHTRRVLATAQQIARTEKADLDIVTSAAIFHDVAKLESSAEEHAARGAQIAAEYFARAGFPDEWTKRVCAAIANHTRADAGNFALEDRILRDADLLDETGALGILWTAMNAGRVDTPSYADVRERIDKFDRRGAARVIELMLTPTGREIAERRLAFVDRFIAQLDEECGVNG